MFDSLLSLFQMMLGLGSAGQNAAAQAHQTELQQQENETNRQWANNQRVQQNIWQQQAHEYNLKNDPLLTMQAYRNAGMSETAALQALGGIGNNGWSPTSNIGSAGSSALPAPLNNTASFDIASRGISQYYEALRLRQDVNESNSRILYNQSMIDRNNKEMDILAKRLGIDQEYLDLAKKYNQSQVDLSYSQVKVNEKKLQEISANIAKIGAEVANINQSTSNAQVEQSNIRLQFSNLLKVIKLNEANIRYIDAKTANEQADLPNIKAELDLNIDQHILNQYAITLEEFRRQISEITGWPPDSDDTDKLIISMATGDYGQVQRLISASSLKQTGYNYSFGKLETSLGNSSGTYNGHKTRPIWNPIPIRR